MRLASLAEQIPTLPEDSVTPSGSGLLATAAPRMQPVHTTIVQNVVQQLAGLVGRPALQQSAVYFSTL